MRRSIERALEEYNKMDEKRKIYGLFVDDLLNVVRYSKQHGDALFVAMEYAFVIGYREGKRSTKKR